MDITQIENVLTKLHSNKKDVVLDDIPTDLQKDFTSFFIGKTFTLKNNTPHFHFHDFEEWYNKVVYHNGITS